jgi:RNA polymerase sigma factor (sigma-70 family)
MAMPIADDAALATAVANGNVAALGAIYDRYSDRLLGFCRSMLRNTSEAEDCLQDVFVIAATRLGGLREPALLRSWLFSVARHECLARIDKRKREVLVDEVADRPSFDPDPSASAALDVELADLLRDAGEGMSDRDRLLLDLADRQQLAGDEFAAAIGVPRATAYTLLARARATAKKSIGALLVARTGRDRCADLDTLLSDWDGQLTSLRRKQIARHIESCATCDDQRSRVASAAALFGEGTAFAARLVSLRTRILDAAAAAMQSELPVTPWEGGWPPADPVFGTEEGRRRRRGLLAALLAAAVLLLLGGVVIAGAVGPTTTVAGKPGLVPPPLSSAARTSPSVVVVTSTPASGGPPTLVTLTPGRTPTRHRSGSTSATPTPSQSSSAGSSSASATTAHHTTTPTHTKAHPTHTKASPTPSRSKSTSASSTPTKSAPPPSTPPTTTAPPPPPGPWTLTVQPESQDITVSWDTGSGKCAGGSLAVPPPCSFNNIPDGSTVNVSIGRSYRYNSPADCTSSVDGLCTFVMKANESVVVHIS